MAYYSEEIIDEVKSANDIVDVVSQYVNLKRQGTTYFGPCPFHREKTPSFAVTPDKQIYHCFGCGEGGNVVRFIMRVENISFKEAIEFLAERAKITLPTTDYKLDGISDEEFKMREYHKNQMYEINKEAGRFFYNNIEKSNQAKEYITKRKLAIGTVRKFGLGFALDDNGLYKFLKDKGFKEEDMLATGLIGKTDKGYFYDKFKNRLMFPIFDVRGRVVAFGGRALASHEELKAQHIPKYVNSPENLIYTKGRHLYGLNLAKKTSEKMKRILVVEGYMDVISPHQFGTTNVVASLGTALTEAQGKLLRQYAEEVVLSYDSDAAGQKAIARGIEIMQSLGVMVKVLQMEGAKDPDEFVLKYGPERFEKLINNSLSAVEYKIKMLKQEFNLQDTTDKIKFLNKMAEVLSKVENNIERDIYVEKLSKEVGVGKEAIQAEVEKFLFKDSSKAVNKFVLPVTGEKTKNKTVDKSDLEEMIIYLLTSKDKSIYEKVKKITFVEDFKIPTNQKILASLYDIYESGNISSVDLTTICSTDDEFNTMTRIMMRKNVEDNFNKIAEDVLKNFEMRKLESKKKELIELIQSASSMDERKKYESELNDIILRSVRR
ncbi:MAG: DNA primase [Clostridia bacterium]|nr:DNA primase [Clostridia bacterium]